MNLKNIDSQTVIDALTRSCNMTQLVKNLGLGRNSKNFEIIRQYVADNDIEYPYLFGMRPHMSVIASETKESLQNIVNNSRSASEILSHFGLRLAGSNATTLKNILRYHSIDTMRMEYNRAISIKNRLKEFHSIRESITYDDVKTQTSSSIRKHIIRNKLLPYKCQVEECGNEGFHCGKPLTLELDHIDGNRSNNELSNLRFLCPSCHSQTETFAGKSRTRKVIRLCSCGNKLGKENLTGRCSSCSTKNRVRPLKFEISKEELIGLIVNNSLLKIGRMFGVSDNAIRKRCIKLGIDVKNISNKGREIPI